MSAELPARYPGTAAPAGTPSSESRPATAIAAAPVARRSDRARRQRVRLALSAVPLLVFVLVAAVGPVLMPYDPVTVRTGERLKPPGE